MTPPAETPFNFQDRPAPTRSAAASARQYVRYPLGLPAGSVRALLALMVVGLICAILSLPPDRQVQVPVYLYYLLFLILGAYFAGRASVPASRGEWAPLYLPRGSLRFLMVVAFAAVVGYGYYKYRDVISARLVPDVGSAAPDLKDPLSTSQPYMPLIILGAFFLGIILSRISHVILAGPTGLPAWYQDVQAWVALLALLGLAAEVIILLIINPTLEPEKQLKLPHWQSILAAIVAFYFGARSF